MISPNFGNVDISAMKGGPTEGMCGQGRRKHHSEVFNLFNATSLGSPNATITNAANFGRITRIADEPWILQMRLEFFL